MNFKYLIILFSLLFFSACTVEYNINIDDSVEESFQIYENNVENFSVDIYGGKFANSLPFDERINQIMEYPQMVLSNQFSDIYDFKTEVDGVIYYKKNLINESQKYGINMKSQFGLNDLQYLLSVRQCYEKFAVSVSEDKVLISTSKVNKCFETYPILDKININLNINFKETFEVVENNATMVDENKYTWVIDRSNYNNQSINIVIDRSPDKAKKTNLSMTLLIVFGIVLVIGGIIYLFFSIRNKSINKF